MTEQQEQAAAPPEPPKVDATTGAPALFLKPTIGRILIFHPVDEAMAQIDGAPLVAILCGVVSDDRVNLSIFDSLGNPRSRIKVPLVQPGQTPPPGVSYAVWPAQTVALHRSNQLMSERVAAAGALHAPK